MKILNAKVSDDLQKGAKIALNLGSGGGVREGYYGVDCRSLPNVDIIANLDEPLSALPDSCVSKVYSRHTLEHIVNIIGLMEEIWRVCESDADIQVIVPHFSNPYYYSDPTHWRPWGIYSMSYFCDSGDQPHRRKVPSNYTDARFKIHSVKIKFYGSGVIDRLVAPVFRRLVNRSCDWQDLYERRIWPFFHAHEVVFNLKPQK